MSPSQFIERFSKLSDHDQKLLLSEVFGMLKALDKGEILINTLEEYEQKSNT